SSSLTRWFGLDRFELGIDQHAFVANSPRRFGKAFGPEIRRRLSIHAFKQNIRKKHATARALRFKGGSNLYWPVNRWAPRWRPRRNRQFGEPPWKSGFANRCPISV